MSASPSHDRPGRPSWRPSLATLLVIAGAFALGLLLFLVLWLQQHRDSDFYRAPVAPTSQAPVFAPLPEPAPAGASDSASGLPEPDENALAERPRLIERQAPTVVPSRPVPAPSRPVAESAPVPISSPPPRYPTMALRRRDEGTVRIRVDVGEDGVPTATTVVESSQSRDLDRAALEAVRRWRFQPAQANGRAVGGSVIVPINFKL
jgi:periplasmic protein TonB